MRYLETSERMLSRDLWEEAFPEDSRQFGDYYFSEKIKDNRVLVLEENGRIDAMIQLNPYELQVKDQRWKIDYLVGVATRKDRRHRGYMRRLLAKMMADMRAEQAPFCFLMPADEAIYRPFGFTFIYDQPWFGWCGDGMLQLRRVSVKSSKDLVRAADWMNRWLADRYQVYAVRDRAYVERLVKEIASEEGTLDLVFDGDQMIGAESFWGLEKKVQRLLYAEAFYIEEVKTPKPAIMARIIDVERFVPVICLKEVIKDERKTIILKIEDPMISENHGIWKWALDHKTSWLEKEEASTIIPDLTLTITELTAWLFGYEIPDAAAAFSRIVQPLQGVFLDEVV